MLRADATPLLIFTLREEEKEICPVITLRYAADTRRCLRVYG